MTRRIPPGGDVYCVRAGIGLPNAPGPVLTKWKCSVESGTGRELRGIIGTPGVPPSKVILGPVVFGLRLQAHQHVSNQSLRCVKEIPVGAFAISWPVELGLKECLPPKSLQLPSLPAHASAHLNRYGLRHLYHFPSP